MKKIFYVLAFAAMLTIPAFAQKAKDPGSHITVSQTPGAAQHNTIQAAVNAARPGQVIEILDTADYAEQVTIDGRESPPWAGVTGGKNNITIRYIPHESQGSGRPKITYQDKTNVSPKTSEEAQSITGACADYRDNVGCAENYYTNGALRILRARDIKIEGLIIDGGGAAPFGYPNVIGTTGCNGGPCPLVHGNAAVAVASSGGIQIRDCQIRNAHFGIYVNDRNDGGAFGNPDLNPSNNSVTIPLSGFGETGNHLFEYNKIGGNIAGIFFEASHDLGSTVRYNLIYNNFVTGNPGTEVPVSAGTDNDKGYIGGIVFKDNYLSPVAIYNNTFYNNHAHLLGGWQAGFQHLIFNNIFGKPRAYGAPGQIHSMGIMGKFPYRMKHNLIAADAQAPTPNRVEWNNFFFSGSPSFAIGSVIQGTKTLDNVNFPSDANNRWFEVDATTFLSLDTSSPDFLAPDYFNSNVRGFVSKKGWIPSTIGPIVTNEDGTPADLGAIPENGKRPGDAVPQKNRARVTPFSVVTMDQAGGQTTAPFIVNNELGRITNLGIRYLRWIAPIPVNEYSFGIDGEIVGAANIQVLNSPVQSITAGEGTKLMFDISRTNVNLTAYYGFFEMVLEGTDASGNAVTTDVGFLPYRRLEHYLDIQVLGTNGQPVTQPVTVTAGKPVEIHVTAKNRNGSNFGNSRGGWLNVSYKLLPDLSARMWRKLDASTGVVSDSLVLNTLRQVESDLTHQDKYTVYFKQTGNTIVQGAGLCRSCENIPFFLGELLLNVKPGDPARVSFLDPVPGGQPPVVNSGEPYEVKVQVQDLFGNAVDTGVEVSLRSLNPGIGDVLGSDSGPAVGAAVTARTGEGGIAVFYAGVTDGATGNAFDLVAAISGGVSDTASLRVGVTVGGDTTFVITFDANGGTALSPDTAVTDTDGRLAELPTPDARPGFTFDGWFTDTAQAGTRVTLETVFDSDTTVYARWTPVSYTQYTVTFDANGGVVSPASAVTDSSGTLALAALPVPDARLGYTFDGWFTDTALTGMRVTPATVFDRDTTVYARWTPDAVSTSAYTVKFNANGGTVSPDSAVTDSSGTLALTALPVPDPRPGYTFDGWFTDTTGGTEVTAATVFTGNATVYARWVPLTAPGDPDSTYTYSGGTLTVNISGAIGNYASPSDVPWSGFSGSVHTVVLGPGVTSIGSNAFSGISGCPAVVSLSPKPPAVASNAFSCRGTLLAPLEYIADYGKADGWKDFADIDVLWRLPGSMRSTGSRGLGEAAVVPSAGGTASKVTAGPNPVSKFTGKIEFYYNGGSFESAKLTIYDAAGNVVRRINAGADAGIGRRQIAVWDLRDGRGRLVSEGSYLVRGVVKGVDDKREKVSLLVSVR